MLENASESPSKHTSSVGTPADLFKGVFDGAIANPYNGVAELLHLPQIHVDESAQNSTFGKAGNLVGSVADFVALKGAADHALNGTALGRFTAGSAMGSAAEMGTIGAVYGGVFTPGQHRLQTALTDGVTFGVMGGAGKALTGPSGQELATRLKLGSLDGTLGTAKVGLVTGALGGAAGSVADSVIEQKFAPGQFIENTAKQAAFGALLGVGSEAVSKSLHPGASSADGANLGKSAAGAAASDGVATQAKADSVSQSSPQSGTANSQLWTPGARHIEVPSDKTTFDLTGPWTDDARILKAQEYERASTSPTLRSHPPIQQFSTHEGTTNADVLVVGGGVGGLMAGSRLAESGANVTLVDGSTIASGTTARGAAMFTRDPDVSQSDYREIFGDDKTASHLQRMDDAQKYVMRVAQGADSFVGHGSYRISYDAHDEDILNDYKLLKQFNPDAQVRLLQGKAAARETGVPSAQTALAFDGEGSADPREVGMRIARTPGLKVHENSPVVGMDVPNNGAGPVEVTMANGSKILADKVVFATGGTVAPFRYLNDKLSGEQCFAAQAAISPDQVVRGNIFDGGIEGVQQNGDDYNYYRAMGESGENGSGRPQLLMGSGSRFLDDENPAKSSRVPNLALRHLFPGAHVNTRWTGTILDTEDGAPIVAQHPVHPQLYDITGLGGTGWLNSSLSAADISDRITNGKETGPYAPERLDEIQHAEDED